MISSKTFLRGALLASAAALGMTLPMQSANATNGYFAHGYGTASKSMAGVGSAVGQDTLAAATNPAAMRDVGTKYDVSLALFSPKRSVVNASVGSGVPDGTYESHDNLFLIPGFGYNRDLDNESSIGLSLYGNGGMNTAYGAPLFGGEDSGVDLAQMFLGLTYARDINSNLSVGITPRLALQRFKAHGMTNFDNSTQSSAPGSVTNNGYDYSMGYGASIGATYDVSSDLTFGAAYHSRTYMQNFDKYKGLFAEQGDFDVPSSYNLGVAFKASDTLTVFADYQRINYGEVAAIANLQNAVNSDLGNDNGDGFGWRDLTTVKLGAAYQYAPDLTLRAGVSHNNQNPYASGQYMFNILAPAVIRTHVSFGGTYDLDPKAELNFSVTRGLEASSAGVAGGGTSTHKMGQWDLEVGYTHEF